MGDLMTKRKKSQPFKNRIAKNVKTLPPLNLTPAQHLLMILGLVVGYLLMVVL